MNFKQIGLIALVVVGVALAAWSLKNSFFSGPAPAGQADAAKWRAIMTQRSKGDGSNGPAGGGMGGRPPGFAGGNGPGGRPAGAPPAGNPR